MSNYLPYCRFLTMGEAGGGRRRGTMRSKTTTPKMQRRAAELRRELMPAEAKLWSYLRAHRMKNVHFRRQHPIGKYVPDFCAPRKKLIIELDGSQHLDQQEYDAERTAFLESKGYRVIRFWNNEVMNDIEGVLRAIEIALNDE